MAEPAGVLGDIAAAKRAELESRFDGISLDALRERAQPTRRSLEQTLARPGARFILEIKKASPSAGTILAEADPGTLARGYSGVADALSVLTDSRFFGGSLAHLAAARAQFDGPVLAKDFLLDPRQVVEARLAGADAILVMLSLVDDERARLLVDEASCLDMDALVEVHDEREMARALALGAPLVGINNRDLRDFSIDLTATERLAAKAPDRLIVSESGIHDRADVERLSAHADAFLVGTSLMRSSDPAEAARELLFGRVKLCGLTRAEDISSAAPATFAGFVFVPGSVRHVDAERVIPLARLARRRGMRPVGVFRDAPPGSVADIADLLGLHAVQLHGREDSDYLVALRRALPHGCEVWTAVGVGRGPVVERGGDRLLFDNGRGGTGRTFDWTKVRDHPALAEAVVAGGIGAHNAREAQRLGAYAIDAGSAMDEVPGRKSPDRMRALFDALRPPCRQRMRICA